MKKNHKCRSCTIKSKCNKFLNSKNNENSNPPPYFSLSPLDKITNDMKNYKNYHKALNFALSDKNIHNIAITGDYGSGKSSVIDSYFKDSCCKDFLKISLATFSVKDKSDTDINLIEKSILQQIFYRKDSKSFPFSRFKRIREYTPFFASFLELCFVCSFLFLIILFNPDCLINFTKIFDLKTKIDILYLISLVITGLGFFFVGFHIINFFLKFRLSKFAFKNVELGLEELKDESLLNKYLDEILYFFEKTDYKTIVFEDLDRFENPEVFYHLRELNSLINNYENTKNRIVFIYALKDNIFRNKDDRAKFFDFIIPIVPIMDSHNSKIILLTDPVLSEKVDKTFLIDISNYMTDMRLLKNCINEFEMYDSIVMSSNKRILFAFIVYKNYYPNSFKNLEIRLNEIKSMNTDELTKIDPFEIFLTNEINKSNLNNIYRFMYMENKKNDGDNKFLKLLADNSEPNYLLRLNDKANVFAIVKYNKNWLNCSAILNNDFLDYFLEEKDKDYKDDLMLFIGTMYHYEKACHDKSFFSQYEHLNIDKKKKYEELRYFYEIINKFILSEDDFEYKIFFENNHKKLLQFILFTNDLNNIKFNEFISKEINLNLEPNDFCFVIQKMRNNSALISFIIENLQDDNTFLQSKKNEIKNFEKDYILLEFLERLLSM